MKRTYRTTSIVGVSLMSIPMLCIVGYVIQPSHIWYIICAIISFLLICILLSFNIVDVIRLGRLKKSGRCFNLRIIKCEPVKLIHVRGFYTFRIISEYEDDDGVKHTIRTPAYSISKFCLSQKLHRWSVNNIKANIYIKNGTYSIEVIYEER